MSRHQKGGVRMRRREALSALGTMGAALIFRGGTSLGAIPATERRPNAGKHSSPLDCVVTPELTEGPFFIEEHLNRSDLTAGTTEPFVTGGLPLLLQIGVFRVKGNACTPLPGAQADIWHSSAEGVYSDEPSGRIQRKDTVGEKYLRGYQRTDQDGAVTFTTIYPGWYHGRTVHIHFKIRIFSDSAKETCDFTSQFFFDDALSDIVLAKAPYNTRGMRRVRNSTDGIYRRGGAADLLLNVQPASSGKGYLGMFNIGLRT